MLGSGPGGYTAAFRAADLGLKVVLVERYPTLGGVCLNVGCIPSKALLHAAKVHRRGRGDGRTSASSSRKPEIDIDALRGWKDGVVKKLTGGLAGLAKARKVTGRRGRRQVHRRRTRSGSRARTGRRPSASTSASSPPGSRAGRSCRSSHDDPRVIDSTGALELGGIPKRLLVIGGGIIGLEMATVYDALGSKVTVVELMDQIIPGADKDIVKPLHKRIEKRYEAIHLKAKVDRRRGAATTGLEVSIRGPNGAATEVVRPRPGGGRPPPERQA